MLALALSMSGCLEKLTCAETLSCVATTRAHEALDGGMIDASSPTPTSAPSSGGGSSGAGDSSLLASSTSATFPSSDSASKPANGAPDAGALSEDASRSRDDTIWDASDMNETPSEVDAYVTERELFADGGASDGGLILDCSSTLPVSTHPNATFSDGVVPTAIGGEIQPGTYLQVGLIGYGIADAFNEWPDVSFTIEGRNILHLQTDYPPPAPAPSLRRTDRIGTWTTTGVSILMDAQSCRHDDHASVVWPFSVVDDELHLFVNVEGGTWEQVFARRD